MNETFLIIYRPGSAWKAGQSVGDQPPPEHGLYLLRLYSQGRLRFGGPFGDDTGAALVVEAADEAQARALIEADPAVSQAIFTYELHPWTLSTIKEDLSDAEFVYLWSMLALKIDKLTPSAHQALTELYDKTKIPRIRT